MVPAPAPGRQRSCPSSSIGQGWYCLSHEFRKVRRGFFVCQQDRGTPQYLWVVMPVTLQGRGQSHGEELFHHLTPSVENHCVQSLAHSKGLINSLMIEWIKFIHGELNVKCLSGCQAPCNSLINVSHCGYSDYYVMKCFPAFRFRSKDI